MHSEHLRNVQISWVAFGWFIGLAVAATVLLLLAGAGFSHWGGLAEMIALALAMAAVVVRCLNWSRNFVDGEVRFQGLDAYYHMRRIMLTIEHWPTKTPHYHSAGDTAGTLNFAYAEQILRVNLAMLAHEAGIVKRDSDAPPTRDVAA